jgi:hypothetical protein
MESPTGHLSDSTPRSSEDDHDFLHVDAAPADEPETSDKPVSGSSPITTPPYWYGETRHGRTVSNASYQSIGYQRPAQILLEDHSEEDNVLSQSCWAKSATIDEYVLVSGPTGIGAYVVWHCTVETLKGGDMTIRKRYSEFDQLRADLVRAFPHAEAMIPQLPRKSVVSRFRPKFLEARKAGLSHFLKYVLIRYFTTFNHTDR